MKKVLLKSEEIVTIDQLTNDSKVGLIIHDVKFIIVRTKDGFCAIEKELDFSAKWVKDSLKEYVISHNNSNAFLFDTKKELFDWFNS